MPITQTHRELEFISPLGKDVLLLHKFEAREQLGRLFEYNLELLSTQEDIDFEALLGQNVAIRLDIDGQDTGYFNGFISEFSQGANSGAFATYSATVSPWLWFLTRTQDCRIFQHQNAVEIIQSVFKDNGYTDFILRLSGSYSERTYTVQYRETDFNFVSRLMEEEGIYYYHEQQKERHTLILCDGYISHEQIPAGADIPYYPPDNTAVREQAFIYNWDLKKSVLPGAVALNDYDFQKSRANIRNDHTHPQDHARSAEEIYDYPGRYLTRDEGGHYARMRQEELHCAYAAITGSGTVRTFTAGGLMQMTRHPRDDQNTEYLITRVNHLAVQNGYGSTQGGETGFKYKNDFTVIKSLTPFRTKSIHQAPNITGPQSAHVVGPEGEEIYCDEYGRVKVQFPWDRYGKHNENSSCWIRVSQNWAGGSWGHMAIPRIGHEVLVEFLEGNPDRPVITGRTYHDMNRVPYPLPANKTRMTIKSKTHKGTGYNELRFEDEKELEQVYLHGQKDQDIIIENDRREHIKHDRHLRVENDRSEEVRNDSSSKVDRDRTEATGRKHTTTVGEEHVIQVGNSFHLKSGKTQYLQSGQQIVIESGAELTLRSSGGFIKIDASGITIQGKTINVNTGGSPGNGFPVQANMAKPALLATSGSLTDVGSAPPPEEKPLELETTLPDFTPNTPSSTLSQAVQAASQQGLGNIKLG